MLAHVCIDDVDCSVSSGWLHGHLDHLVRAGSIFHRFIFLHHLQAV
jgi:hypothetical protein